MQYKVDEPYAPDYDGGILWNDAELGINWPITSPILSVKDAGHRPLAEVELNFNWKEEGES